jgi:ComF family protein
MFKAGVASVNEVTKGLATIGQYLTSLALPPVCCLCACQGAPDPLDLCEYCRAALPGNLAANDYPAIFTRAVVPFSYAYPVDHCIRALKFKGERVYARVFGALLADARAQMGAPLPDVVVPVPLHDSRYRERGFNQAHEIARFAARRLGIPVASRMLMRAAKTREQSGLPLTERISNVRGAFAMRAALVTRAAPTLHCVALVDDVLTTGSTASEAASVLRVSGAKEIELWAIARVSLD